MNNGLIEANKARMANICRRGYVRNERVRLYRIWRNMRARCTYPSKSSYHRYGGRGISVCDAWEDYATFREWAISNGYNKDVEIDRIDNDGNYEPSNCRWVSHEANCAPGRRVA